MYRFLKPLLAAGLTAIAPHIALAQDGLRVVTVNHALQYLAERLVGEGAEVVLPVPQDVDPSFWRPSIADISAIQSADLIVLNGAGFATWTDRVSLPRAKVVNTTAQVEDQFIITESITHSHGEGDTHSHEGLASYTWLDPTLAIAQADAIAAALVRRNLGEAAAVKDRLATLKADLETLDAALMSELAGVQDIAIIATHPRYEYFARRYGLSVTSMEWEAGLMPTDDELADLAARVAQTGARILIWEAEPPQAAIEAARAQGLHSVTFVPLAHADGDRAFLDVLAGAASAMSDAAKKVAAE